jgi:hypothetical protein
MINLIQILALGMCIRAWANKLVRAQFIECFAQPCLNICEEARMREKRIWTFIALVLWFALPLVACAPKASPTPAASPAPIEAETSEAQPGPEQTAETEITPAAPSGPEGAASDLPIMENAYKLQVLRGGNSVTYQVDGSIQDVVNFYQEALPQYGWEMAGPPDSAVGSIATMLRKNQAGDSMSINMQENKLGGFVSITIQIIRAPKK